MIINALVVSTFRPDFGRSLESGLLARAPFVNSGWQLSLFCQFKWYL